MGRLSSSFRSRVKHYRPLRPLLESLERRDLLASFATLEDKPLVVSDPNLAHIVIVSNPAHGTVSLTDLGGFVYKPAEDYNGTDSFVYGRPGESNTTVGETVTASITITPVNDAPSGTNKTVTLLEDTSYTLQANDFGFADPKDAVSHNLLAVRITTLPELGKLFNSDAPVVSGQVIPFAAIANNRLRYVPANAPPATNTNPTATTRFTFQVQDDGGTTNGGVDLDPTPNTITLNVTPVNDAPTGTDVTRSVPQNVPYVVQLADFGFIDSNDVPSNSLRAVTIVTLPTKGQLQDNGVPVVAGQSIPVSEFVGSNTAGTVQGSRVKYIPDATSEGLGTFSFTFAVQDNGGTANGGVDLDPEPNKFTINVTAVQQPKPEARADFYSLFQNGTLTIGVPGVLGNDSGINGRPLTASLEPEKGPLHGTVELKADGSFTYKPTTGYVGVDTFVYRATDVSPAANPLPPTSSTALVTIFVKPNLPAIFANPDFFETKINTALDIAPPGVLKNDYVIVGDPVTNANGTVINSPNYPLSAVLVSQPNNGTVELKSDGSLHYVPKADFTGADTFTYRAMLTSTTAATDQNALTHDLATVTINVRPIIVPPFIVANNDVFETKANTAIEIGPPGVLKNDLVLVADPASGLTNTTTATSPLNYLLAANLISPPANGELKLNSDGSFRYVPKADFTGSDTFTYRASLASSTPTSTDATATGHDLATVTINVHPIVALPIANNDEFHVKQDTVLIADPPGVLANDKPLEGHKLAAKLVSDVSHGKLNFTESGGFTYTPASGFTGLDSFTYYAQDVATNETTADPIKSNVATVKIYVQPTSIRVFAFDDQYKVVTNTTLAVDKPGVLGNDTTVPPPVPLSPNDDTTNAVDPATGLPSPVPTPAPLRATLLSGPTNGELTLNPDGSFKYTPKANYVGLDSFTYRASVLTTTIPGGTTTTQAASDSTSSLLACPINGICPPLPDDVATVTIYVKAPEPPPGPVAINDYYFTAENTALGIGVPGVLANDFIRGGIDPTTGANDLSPIKRPLTAVLVAGPTNGLLSLNSDGSFKYLPNKDFVGTDTFTYQDILSTPVPTLDGSTVADFAPVMSNVATVTIRVVPAVAHNDNYTTDHDQPLEIIKPGVLANDAGGSDAHPLMATLLSGPLHGALKLQTDGSFRYEPAAGYVGADMFTYRASDGQPTIDPSTGVLTTATGGDANRPISAYDIGVVKIYVRLTVPTIQAHDDKYPALKNTTLTIESPGVLANDYGPVNVPVVAAVADKPIHGTLTLNEKGDFTYVPAADFVGEDKFTYTANVVGSAAGTTNSTIQGGLATVTIYVMAPEAPPTVIIGRNQTTTDESGPQKVTDFAAIVAVGNDGLPLTIAVTTDKPNLFKTLPTIDAAGQLVYTPAPNASGTATITVNVGDPTTSDPGQAETFTIHIDKPHLLYNAALPCDVTGDDTIAADDALAVINHINAQGDNEAAALSLGAGQHFYYDVDKDDVIAALDVLLIINHINAQPNQTAATAISNEVDASLLALVAQDAAEATTGKRKT